LSLIKLKKIKKDISALISNYDANDILGPIPNLELCLEELESAIEEMSEYEKSDSSDDDDED
jgi:hypothetical protein